MSHPWSEPGIFTTPVHRDGFVDYLRRHPVLALFFLSPGIPEYLSGSSQLGLLVLDLPKFLLLLILNAGLYVSGVLLVREAKLRWRKGWGSVFLLGFAYAIVEEGLALRTFYNPSSPVVGNLGVYGHWAGVNWVWTVGLLLFHSVFSIALPILLFNLAFPSLSSKSLLPGMKPALPILALALDSVALSTIVNYSLDAGVLLLSVLAVVGFVVAARKLPRNFLGPASDLPARGPRTLGLIGVAFFPAAFLVGGVAAGANVPPLVPMVVDFLVAFGMVKLVYRYVGREQNQAHKVALVAGLLTPVVVFGIIGSVATIPLVIGVDVLLALFARRLWRRYRSLPIIPGLPTIITPPNGGPGAH